MTPSWQTAAFWLVAIPVALFVAAGIYKVAKGFRRLTPEELCELAAILDVQAWKQRMRERGIDDEFDYDAPNTADTIAALGASIPAEEWDKVPDNLSMRTGGGSEKGIDDGGVEQ